MRILLIGLVFMFEAWAGSSVVECLVRNQEVGGPIPPQSTILVMVGDNFRLFFLVFLLGFVFIGPVGF